MKIDYLGLRLKRLNRSSYFLTLLVSMFLFVGFGLALDAIFRLIFHIETADNEPGGLYIVFLVGWWVFAIYCIVRRLHDLNMSSWWLIAAFIPFANLFVGIQVLFVKGSPKNNKYGEHIYRTFILGLGL